MMYVLMMIVAVSGIEAVELKKESTGVTFPGKQATVNGSPSMVVSRPSTSVLDCGIQCLTDGDCVAANFESGVCHKVISTSGHFSPQDIRLDDNKLSTAILPEPLPESTSTETLPESTSTETLPESTSTETLPESPESPSTETLPESPESPSTETLPESPSTETLPESTSAADPSGTPGSDRSGECGPGSAVTESSLVGWWPLQEACGGKDLSGYGNDITLYGVTFEDDGATPWASPAAEFHGTSASYGHIQHGQHLDVKSFSWMAKVYPQESSVEVLFQWRYNGDLGVYIYLYSDSLRTYIYIPGCSFHWASHPTTLPLNAWHTLAVTYDFPTNTLTLWENGESHVSTKPACGTNIETSQELYIGNRYNDAYPFHGRLGGMSLYSAVVDYDVMYNATMSHCGGE